MLIGRALGRPVVSFASLDQMSITDYLMARPHKKLLYNPLAAEFGIENMSQLNDFIRNEMSRFRMVSPAPLVLQRACPAGFVRSTRHRRRGGCLPFAVRHMIAQDHTALHRMDNYLDRRNVRNEGDDGACLWRWVGSAPSCPGVRCRVNRVIRVALEWSFRVSCGASSCGVVAG